MIETMPELDIPKLPNGYFFKIVKLKAQSKFLVFPVRMKWPECYAVELHSPPKKFGKTILQRMLLLDGASLRSKVMRIIPLTKENIELTMWAAIKCETDYSHDFRDLFYSKDSQTSEEIIEAESAYLSDHLVRKSKN